MLVKTYKLNNTNTVIFLQNDTEIISRATKSVPSPIKNLVDVNKHVNISQLLSAIGYVP